jgi:hypothetical protein
MIGYIQIIWRFDDFDLPRVLFLEDEIGEDELVEIVETKSTNKVLSLSQFDPKAMFLNLYVGTLREIMGSLPVLILSISPTPIKEFEDVTDVERLHCFGRFKENVMVLDSVRILGQQCLVREEGTILYFQELTNVTGKTHSLLQLIQGIFHAFKEHVSQEDQQKSEFQALTLTWDN